MKDFLRTFSCRSTQFMKMMWKSLVQGHIDYASQLYQPLQSGNLTRIENLFKTFTKRIPEIRELNYWERLAKLQMNSQQRRFERYRILYIWKVLEGLVPNPGVLTSDPGPKGRLVKIPSCAPNLLPGWEQWWKDPSVFMGLAFSMHFLKAYGILEVVT